VILLLLGLCLSITIVGAVLLAAGWCRRARALGQRRRAGPANLSQLSSVGHDKCDENPVLLAEDRWDSAPTLLADASMHRRVGPDRGRHLDRLSAASAALALMWTIGAILALFFVPMVASESASSTAGSDVVVVTRQTRPLIQVRSPVKVAAMVVAGLVLAAGFRAGRPPRSVLLVLGWSTMVLVVVSGFSIGFFFLPVPLLLLVAGMTAPAPMPLRATRSPDGQS
jgi:hypothetical protein